MGVLSAGLTTNSRTDPLSKNQPISAVFAEKNRTDQIVSITTVNAGAWLTI